MCYAHLSRDAEGMNTNPIRTLPTLDVSARDLFLLAELNRLAAEGDRRVLPPRRPLRAFVGLILTATQSRPKRRAARA